MFRVVLAIYVLMLSLMGPSPCCCSVARVARTILSTMEIGENSEFQWPACCQEGSDDTESGDSGDQSPFHSHRSGDHCKCVQSTCRALPTPPTEYTVDMSRSWLDHLILDVGSPVLSEVVCSYPADHQPDEVLQALSSGREIRIELCSWVC